MGSTPGEDAVKTVEITTIDLEHDITSLIKQQQGSRALTPILKEVLWVNALKQHCTLQRDYEKQSLSLQQMTMSYLQKLPQPPQPSASTPDESAVIHIKVRPSASNMVMTG